ncbi:MAG TPA: ABC transporter ATP-binding protein [Thermoanaerobaculia bacterium]
MSNDALTWPLERLGELLAALAPTPSDAPPMQVPEAVDEPLDHWITQHAQVLGAVTFRENMRHYALEPTLSVAGRMVVWIRDSSRFVGVVEGTRKEVRLLTPDQRIVTLSMEETIELLTSAFESPVSPAIEQALTDANVPPKRRERVRRTLLEQRASHRTVCIGWRLEPDFSESYVKDVRNAGLLRDAGGFALAYVAQFALQLLAWVVVASFALGGLPSGPVTVAWILLLASAIFLQVTCSWWQGLIAIRLGVVLKQRLLAGALRVDEQVIRSDGESRLLGRVLEANVVEQAIVNGAFVIVIGFIELGFAAWVLARGASGGWLAAALAVWMAAYVVINYLWYRRRRAATESRIEMTHDLVEKMIGHRTQIAQDGLHRAADEADRHFAGYYTLARRTDRWSTAVEVMSSHAWTLFALLILAPFIVVGTNDPVSLAIAVGGIILVERAMQKLASAVWQIVDGAIAAKQVWPILRFAAKRELPGIADAPATSGETLLEARDVLFRYAPGYEPIVRRWSLSIAAADRILLEGSSGSGKSTLASVVGGLRRAESGMMLLRGLDLQTLGELRWRKSVVIAPQFHENHIFSESFAFNLLMGKRWPPWTEDMDAAQQVCEELGLSELIQKMPGGIFQMVGDTGWQLSHGERSRVFIARALLQQPDVLVLDESFAALDPDNFERALECVLRRPIALVLIAHV